MDKIMDKINSAIGFVKDIEKIYGFGKDIGPKVWKYVRYQTCHDDYISDFKEMQGKLKRRLSDVDAILTTQQDERPRKIPKMEVDAWREKVRKETAEDVVEDLICRGGFLTKIRSSRKLDKKTQGLNKIFMEGGKYTDASVDLVVDNHSIKGVPLLDEECKGRDGIQEKILKWLKEDKATRIAVWGMGGVGKTTIMKQVHNQLLKESKFKKVIWVKVSKDFDIIAQQKKKFDILKFQKMIASSLELKLEPEDHENETKLAGLISQRLGQGSFVLILDDVWEEFRPEDVGIPDLVGCKLVLTTRLQNVARAMDCEVILVDPLPPDEALALFLEKVGSVVLSDGKIKRDIEPFLKQILQKCNGVPLAIVTVAKSMRRKPHSDSWKLALSEFREFKGILDCLKFSYECVEPQCRECFLRCALYPEDYEIPKEELIEYWIEEGLTYEEGKTREAMYWKGHDILDKLVDNCLLESVEKRYKKDSVSMHDLLREMALEISAQFLVKAGMGLKKLPEEHEWREDLLKISLMRNHIREIPSSMSYPKYPKLTTLLLSDNNISTIPEAFFNHMPGLKILDLSNNPKLSRLPSSVSKLEKLTTLLLRGCVSLREVPNLSKFGDLKKLDLSRTTIEEVPQGLNMLTNLKYLCLGGEISVEFGRRLSKIPDGLLQNFSKLQHLKVGCSIPLKGKEIGRLGKLEYLKGWFSTVHDMSIFVNSRGEFLNMYNLFVGSSNSDFIYHKELKTIVCCDIDICGELNWLPSNVQNLKINRCKDVRSLNSISGFQDATDLRYVKIKNCDGMEFVVSLSWLSRCNLEELLVHDLDNLNAVFREKGAVAKSTPLPGGTFSSLQCIEVFNCKKIEKLFSVRWLGYLQNLQTIHVYKCEKMEEIIWSEYEVGEKVLEKVTIPKLERLELRKLHQLKSIYSSSSTVLIGDSIKSINIGYCPNIESVIWSRFNPLPTIEHLRLHALENLKVVFDEETLGLLPPLPTTPTIKTIRVDGCDKLKKVFSSGWLLGYFQFLEIIHVRTCQQMEELISSLANEEEKVTLPRLQSLKLTHLPQLKSICSSSSTVLICDSIKIIRIMNCPKIENVFWSRFSPLPTLEDLTLMGIENLKYVFDEEALGLSPPLATTPTIFFSLKKIRIQSCPQLKKVFSSLWLLGYFQSLETIYVSKCKQMEELISSSTYEEERVTLPNLRSLELVHLPAFKSIYSSSIVLICDSIKEISIRSCKNIESVFGSRFNPFQTLEYLHLEELKNLKSVFNEEALGLSPPLATSSTISFSLETIRIQSCPQLKNVFSSGWLLGYFQFLERIHVSSCKQMEELISSSAYEEEKVTLPKLLVLELKKLLALKSICSSSSVLNCDSIQLLRIVYCKKLKRIPLIFPQSFHPLFEPMVEIIPKECWESLEWDDRNAKDILSPSKFDSSDEESDKEEIMDDTDDEEFYEEETDEEEIDEEETDEEEIDEEEIDEEEI